MSQPYKSGRQQNLNLGISSITENSTVLQTIGKVGIGTTNAQNHSLFVVGSTNITGNINVGGASTFVGVVTNQSTIFGTQLSVSGVSTFTGLIDANGGATIDNIQIGITNDNTIDTVTGNLILDSFTNTIKLNANSDVEGTLSSTGNLTVTSETDSTSSSSTASIKTSGGVSIAKKIFIGETIESTGGATVGEALQVNSNTAGSSQGAGALKVPNGGAYIGGTLHLGGAVEATSHVKGSQLQGTLQYSITVAGSAFNNTGNVSVSLPDKTKITVSGSTDAGINNGFRADMTATRNGDADTLMFRGINGGTAVGSGGLTSAGDITAYYTSDQRLKTNIELIDNALSKVCDISGVTFNWNSLAASLNDENPKDTTVREAGVIAQEIQKVLPEVVNQREDGYLSVRYEQIVPLLIEAIKELKAEINELKGVK